MKLSLKPLLTLSLGILLLLPAAVLIAPNQAHAQVCPVPCPTIEVGPLQTITGTIATLLNGKQLLNPIFYALGQQVLSSVVKSTVNWINSGFSGSPAFVTDLQGTLLQAGDTEAQLFINQFLSNGLVNSPFRDVVGQVALNNYLQSSSGSSYFLQNPYTLNQVSPNPTALLSGDIVNGGGLSAWLSLALHPQNNPINAQTSLQIALNGNVASAQGSLLTQLGWGNGFKSFQGNCGTSEGTAAGTAAGNAFGGGSVSLTNFDNCVGQPIKTPGTVIMASLNKSLGSNIDTLVNAKEFDEIVNALLSQLLNKVLGSGGLTGLSEPTASGQSFLDNPGTTPGLSSGVGVASSITQIISSQIVQLQQFVTNWQTILSAATTAKTALGSSTCFANASTTITTTVQPIIDQAALEISRATTATTALTHIAAEIPTTSSTGDSTLQSAQASTDYTAFLSATSTPTTSDVSYAGAQSLDTASSTPSSLLTQMNQLTAQAKCGN